MARQPVAQDEKLDKQDFDLFEALSAIDRKDYGYYDRLSPEQQKKFVPYMMLHWISAVKAGSDIQNYYLQSTNYHANKYMFNENVQKNPKLQWLMLCAASPGIGKQFHQYIPHIRDRVSKLKEQAKHKEIKDYYKKVFPKANDSELSEIADVFVENQHKKHYLATKYPNLKYDDIELLSDLITDKDIENYERDSGN